MPSLDSQIDALYQQPLDTFTAARNALAKTLTGSDAAQVKKLAKPTVVPWAVNQLYWHARHVYDRVRETGERLRAAQIAALKGKASDVRAATDAQRKAIADAVKEAIALAVPSGAHPNADELTRTLEALSLAANLPEPPGRLTRALQPAGFEALAGVTPVAVPRGATPQTRAPAAKPVHTHEPADPDARKRERERLLREKQEEAERAAARRKVEAELRRAEAAVDRAKATEAQARAAWERAREQLRDAERAAAEARRAAKS